VPERIVSCSKADRGEDLGQAVSNQLIGEPNHPIPCRSEDCLSFGIPIPLRRVNSSIDLDNKSTFCAAEVDDERTDWMLAAELHPVQATAA